jgi:sterol desaturase/sphingolipid hydroxylase (fatty acid hydroxylase superfamily)
VAEMMWPAREVQASTRARWKVNGGFYATNLVLLSLVPISSFGAALYAAHQGIGLFAAAGWADGWLSILGAILVLDLSKYLLHYVLHRVPALWRLHKVHHADPDMDLSTGVRFHPLEALITWGWSVGVMLLLGPPVLAALIHEVIVAAFAFLGHANVQIPAPIERRLRWVLVTPQMHSVHHSLDPFEGNHNFGGFLSAWDRLFRTYLADTRLGLRRMRFGLAAVAPETGWWRLFGLPFRRG